MRTHVDGGTEAQTLWPVMFSVYWLCEEWRLRIFFFCQKSNKVTNLLLLLTKRVAET